MKILDATASNRSMWYQKDNPFTTFLDQRKGKEYLKSKNSNFDNHQIISIFPDIQAMWQNLPIKNECFDMIVFDPPHIIRNKGSTPGLMQKKYGTFYKDSWKIDMGAGLVELFRVLKEGGIFVFKWNQTDVLVDEPLKLFPYKPIFGTRTGQKNNTHWIVFLKTRQEKQLSEYE